jgi:hypothetical protein
MRHLLSIILISSAFSWAAAGEPAKVPWGSGVSKDYTVWRWIEAFTDDDERGWDELGAEQQAADLSKAVRACSKAQAKLSATRGQTDGKAILAVSDGDLEYLAVCRNDGEAVSASLQETRDRLAAIKARADKGVYNEADMAWLRTKGITMEYKPPPGAEDAKKLADRAKKQEKTAAAVKKKYDGMKDMDEAKAKKFFDGGKGGTSDADSAAVNLSGKKFKGQALKADTRDPKKKLTSTAPPDISGRPKPAQEGTFTWNGKKISAGQQAQLDKCRAQKCELIDMLRIVDPAKLKAPHSYASPASAKEIAKMEKEFKNLAGRELTFNDLLALRSDAHGPASGYESNNLAALEHKYFVNDQVKDALARCPSTPGLYHACYLATQAMLRVAAPTVYEYGKSYMANEKKAAAGDPFAVTQQVLTLPMLPANLAVKGLVIGSKDGVSMETVKKTFRPADAGSIGSTPSGQNILCAVGVFCGD